VKLPVSSWTAAEAANLLCVWVTNLILGTFGLKQNQATAASRRLLPENEGKGRVVKPDRFKCHLPARVKHLMCVNSIEKKIEKKTCEPVKQEENHENMPTPVEGKSPNGKSRIT
jgi:hypothetical protein